MKSCMVPTEESSACVLVTATLAQLLPVACCHSEQDAKDRSSWALQVRVLQTKSDTGLLRLAWRCPSTIQHHSQWFDANAITFIHKAANANTLLGRGPHEQSFEAENDGRIELWTNPRLGRFTVAKRQIAAGECALQATAFAVVVKQQLARQRCHWCFTLLSKKAFQCGGCQFALYCSRDCLDADDVLHSFQCRTLGQLGDDRAAMTQFKSEWESVRVDIETVRLTLAVLSMENFVRTTVPLARLVVNSGGSAKNSRVVAQVARFLAAGITSSSNGVHPIPTLVHIQKTLERVQANAHPLCLNGMATVGVGLFPEAAMALNHSCLPNVVPSFDLRSRTLRFHAIRAIPRAHAVESAYIDLFQATARRQEALLDGFGFDCLCCRCVHEPQPQPLSPEQAQEEQQIMKQLLNLRSGQSQPQLAIQRAEELLSRHPKVFDRNPEMRFAFHMLQMMHAATVKAWPRVIREAETLMAMWTALRLPSVHPTMEILHTQVEVAAGWTGDAARAALATTRVQEIQRICGFQPVHHHG